MGAVADFLIFPIDLINYWDIWDNISNRIWSEELNRAEIIKICLGTRVGEFDLQAKWVDSHIQIENKLWFKKNKKVLKVVIQHL